MTEIERLPFEWLKKIGPHYSHMNAPDMPVAWDECPNLSDCTFEVHDTRLHYLYFWDPEIDEKDRTYANVDQVAVGYCEGCDKIYIAATQFYSAATRFEELLRNNVTLDNLHMPLQEFVKKGPPHRSF